MAKWGVVVIGGGVAGLSAGAAVAGEGLSCLVIDRMGGGGELMNLGQLHGVDDALAGPDFAADLIGMAMAAGTELGVAEVTMLARDGTGWRVTTDDGDHHAEAVIVAVGLAPGSLGIADEQDFEGRGLSFCAACDGPIYAGHPVVVAGADRWAIAEAHELSPIASEVILISQDAPAPMVEGVGVLEGRIVALEGRSGLDTVVVEPAGGGTLRRLSARAVFVQSGRRPPLGFVPDELVRDATGRLIVDADLRTSLRGLFAVGEARAGSDRTIPGAAADGRRAAASVCAALGRR